MNYWSFIKRRNSEKSRGRWWNRISNGTRPSASNLFEKEEENILRASGEMPEESETQLTKKEKNASDDFTKRVNRAIRRAFLKMGAAVCAVTLVVVLLILFVLPNIVSNFYYDPGRIVGENSSGGTTNQMSLDLAVYTELALPGTYRDDVQVEDRGYGNYDINIYQSVSRSGEFIKHAI